MRFKILCRMQKCYKQNKSKFVDIQTFRPKKKKITIQIRFSVRVLEIRNQIDG